MVAHPSRMTLAEFEALTDDGNLHEFVRGEVRVMPPPAGEHGSIELAIMAAIHNYLAAKAVDLGWRPEQGLTARDWLVGYAAVGGFGLQFALPDDPAQIRGADGAYIPADQLARVAWNRRGYFPEVPHLVMEVVSPSESATDVNEKVEDYLAGGARRVWLVYPSRRTVHIRDADAPTRVLRAGDTLTDDELLPGFALPLASIFPDPTDD